MLEFWPQITLVCISLIGIGIEMAKHGQPRQPYNIYHQLIATAITYWLLWAGGFFDKFLSH